MARICLLPQAILHTHEGQAWVWWEFRWQGLSCTSLPSPGGLGGGFGGQREQQRLPGSTAPVSTGASKAFSNTSEGKAKPRPPHSAQDAERALTSLLTALPQFPLCERELDCHLRSARRGRTRIHWCVGCKELCSCKTQYKCQVFIKGEGEGGMLTMSRGILASTAGSGKLPCPPLPPSRVRGQLQASASA